MCILIGHYNYVICWRTDAEMMSLLTFSLLYGIKQIDSNMW